MIKCLSSVGKHFTRKRIWKKKNSEQVSEDLIEVKKTDHFKDKIKLSSNYVLRRKEDAEPATQEAI